LPRPDAPHAYTQSELDHLDGAVADGTLQSTLADGSRTRSRDLAELKEARCRVAAQISGGPNRTLNLNLQTLRNRSRRLECNNPRLWRAIDAALAVPLHL
jgi:hypothetical protein